MDPEDTENSAEQTSDQQLAPRFIFKDYTHW